MQLSKCKWRACATMSAVLMFASCSKAPGDGAQGGQGASGAASEVLQEPGEAPAARLLVVPDPGPSNGSQEQIGQAIKRGPLKIIDEDGKTFADFTRESFMTTVGPGSFPGNLTSDNLTLDVTSTSGERLFIDMVNKKKIVNPKINYLSYFSDGLATARADNNAPCGWADELGNMRMAGRFTGCGPFKDGVAIVQETKGISFWAKTKVGLVDTNGVELVPLAEGSIKFIGNGRYAITGGSGMTPRTDLGIYDLAQKRLIPLPGLKEVMWFNSSAALLTVEGGRNSPTYYLAPSKDPVVLKVPGGLIGKNLTTYKDDKLTVTSPDGTPLGSETILFRASQGAYRNTLTGEIGHGQVGIIGEGGKWIVAPEQSSISHFTHGWASVLKGGRWRIVDIAGRTLFELKGEPDVLTGRFIETIAPGSAPGTTNHEILNRAGKCIYRYTEPPL